MLLRGNKKSEDFIHKTKAFYSSHSRAIGLFTFFSIWIAASLIFFARFPNNFLFPNFFAEDGQHFVTNIIDKGFLGGLLSPFNGYFIFGIYILTGFGFIVNNFLFGGEFIHLPASLALVSYMFLGLCAALPVLLLKQWLSLPYRLAIALLICLLPMPSFDYGTIGTIGNLKFAFNFIAVLLVLYRIKLPRDSYRIIVVDICLAISAFTTAGVYLILPFILLSDGLQFYRRPLLGTIKSLLRLRNVSLISGCALALFCLVQVGYVFINGVPKFPGYLDEPYKIASTVEVFVARPYLYPFVNTLYKHLNDIIVVVLFILSLLISYKYIQRKNFAVLVITLVSILTTSLIFIVNRPGTAYHYNNYASSGFDNFFYAQNFIAIILFAFVLSGMNRSIGWVRRYYIAPIAVIVLATFCIRTNLSYAPNDFMQYQIGTIYEQVDERCKTDSRDITFSVYPFTFLTMTEPREQLCTSGLSQAPRRIENVFLSPENNDTINLAPKEVPFTQTFVSTKSNLSGLALYLGTYNQSVLKDYHFVLFDVTCTATIRSVKLPYYVHDNAYREITFEPIKESAGKTYCFSIHATSPTAQQLAIRLSGEGVYPTGRLHLNAQPSNRDVTFSLLYK